MKSISDISHKETILLMDDLHDNTFFLDFVSKNNKLNWKILKDKNGYVGIIYPKNLNS